MNSMMDQIRSQVIGNKIVYWCENKEGVKHEDSLDSGFTCIRFTTEYIDSVFGESGSPVGVWKCGQFMMYEIHNNTDNMRITCTASIKDLSFAKRKKLELLAEKNSVKLDYEATSCVLREWIINDINIENINGKLDDFYENEIPAFEKQLESALSGSNNQSEQDSDFDILMEGFQKENSSNKYERNREARKKCIEYYGAVCQICGFDFGKVYGKEFAGRIDVHHIKPISEIGHEYVVDPIKDLIPVCPNCHAACHYKKDGVYLPDEIRKKIIK